jgi:hypothetical protein
MIINRLSDVGCFPLYDLKTGQELNRSIYIPQPRCIRTITEYDKNPIKIRSCDMNELIHWLRVTGDLGASVTVVLCQYHRLMLMRRKPWWKIEIICSWQWRNSKCHEVTQEMLKKCYSISDDEKKSAA